MQINSTRLIYTLVTIFVLPISVFGQNLTEIFQKHAWHEAPVLSMMDWEMLLPAADTDTIYYNDAQQLETLKFNEAGAPKEVTLYSKTTGAFLPMLKSKVQYANTGHITSLTIYEWKDAAWLPSARFERLFDANGEDQSFVMDDWKDGNWHTSYAWKKLQPIFTMETAISVAGRP